MTIQVIGGDKASGPWEQAAQEYTKRLGRYCRVEFPSAPPAKTGHQVVIRPGGRSLSSPEWARWLQDLQNSGISDVAFFIDEGEGEGIALSGLDLPGPVVRALLLEQVYRGFKILRGETYHK